MMMKKELGTKLIFHYDTTSRSRIDGERPSLILNFSGPDSEKCKMIPLRPIFFAHEDRGQIVKLIIETLRRLLATLSDEGMTLNGSWKRLTP